MYLKKLIFLFFPFWCFAQTPKVHSHNDYVRKVPFYEAFSADCASIEADLHLKNGILYVAHDAHEVRETDTFRKMYLDPLRLVYANQRYQELDLQLLIDFKTAALPTLAALIKELEDFPDLIQTNSPLKTLKFVISGNRPSPKNYTDYPGYISFDHQDLTSLEMAPMDKIALISFSFQKFSVWDGKSPLSDEEKEKLKSVIKKVHSYGKAIRFWATPDTPLAWETMLKLGVDFINTDQPHACASFLKKL